MEIFGKKFNRKDYLSNQINRSEDKFEYCKVRYADTWDDVMPKFWDDGKNNPNNNKLKIVFANEFAFFFPLESAEE